MCVIHKHNGIGHICLHQSLGQKKNDNRQKESFSSHKRSNESVKKHSAKNTTHMSEDIHISVRQLPYSKISPPRVGPKITATLESNI